MPINLIFAIISITLALIFYTIGVFGEKRSGILKKKHVILFWIGLVFDTTGTTLMSFIARQMGHQFNGMSQNLHGITGLAAILLMMFHAVWATWVLYKGDSKKQETFHKFSILVWLIWLIPYVLGMIIGMS